MYVYEYENKRNKKTIKKFFIDSSTYDVKKHTHTQMHTYTKTKKKERKNERRKRVHFFV